MENQQISGKFKEIQVIFMITTLRFQTSKNIELIDITKRLNSLVKHIKEGYVIIFTQHTTTALWINEAEQGLINDIKRKLDVFASLHNYYEHDDFKKRKCPPNERRNGFSHLRTTLFQNSLAIPVKEGRLMLGRYQSVFFIELDGPRKKRNIVTQIIKT